MEKKDIISDDSAVVSLQEVVILKERSKKKKKKKSRKAQEKAMTEKHVEVKEEPIRVVKLVLGDDIRWAQIPADCSMIHLRETVGKKFPNLKAILIKYKDKEDDLVTITTSEELRWAEESADPQGSLRLYLTEVSPENEPWLADIETSSSLKGQGRNYVDISENGSGNSDEKSLSTYIDDWIVQFAQLFKNQLGFSSDAYLNLHELGIKLYSEAIEDTVTSEEAQEILKLAEGKFQEMVALALFNWGNVHMSRARKKLFLSEDASKESVLERVKEAYKWAHAEYIKAGKRYEEALKTNPDFYEGHFALAQQQFEQAKLSWYYAIGSNIDLDVWPSAEVFGLFNDAEYNMEKGTEMWEKMEELQLKELTQPRELRGLLEKMGMNGYFKELPTEAATEQTSNMRSQINMLWGSMLSERSAVEFKLGLPTWEGCLMAAVEKLKLAGVSSANVAVIIRNHCANATAQEGFSLKIDEVVQAWNEMYDAKRGMDGLPSFRLEPLFHQKAPNLYRMMENI
ncbi:unnamed protein product [Musa acuminata subsp. malaccensis]|uniref:(wild Malaysian banana) hypothetical protein n=1 Tax=Musa acuminata subsp. malaccensis TaxID=214687 RepID=A0A804IKW4_MUSAM|nr:PREDICTED: uncharacterized protein LOC103981543 [Musa acuminata subsp. malaccensis]CAG1841154.1 unnamed protein product [Musa acuminata subsp. malaccensis]